MSKKLCIRAAFWIVAVSGMALVGCMGRATLFPNPDENLHKTAAQFAADAAKRFPYKADAPRGGQAIARAEVNYGLDLINLVNLSDEDWQNVEVWVNRTHVIFVPSLPRKKQETLNFQMIFNDSGEHFPRDNDRFPVTRVEIYRNGVMYDVPLRLAD